MLIGGVVWETVHFQLLSGVTLVDRGIVKSILWDERILYKHEVDGK